MTNPTEVIFKSKCIYCDSTSFSELIKHKRVFHKHVVETREYVEYICGNCGRTGVINGTYSI